jgi:hypothetical protein
MFAEKESVTTQLTRPCGVSLDAEELKASRK